MTGWMAEGSCNNHPNRDWWFPQSGAESNRVTPKARAVCQTCPVLAECAAYTQKTEDTHGRVVGLWAGTTAKQRLQRPLPPQPTQCVECQTVFDTTTRQRRYCTRACRQRAYCRQNTRPDPQEPTE